MQQVHIHRWICPPGVYACLRSRPPQKRASVRFHMRGHSASLPSLYTMASTQEKKYQCVTSEIELGSTHSESQLNHDALLLDFIRHDGSAVPDSEDGTHNADETVQGTAVEHEHSHARLLNKGSEPPRNWPTSPQAVKVSIRLLIWRSLVDVALFSLSVAFLVFALLVIRYNNRPTSSHRQAAQGFEQASKWVRTCTAKSHSLCTH